MRVYPTPETAPEESYFLQSPMCELKKDDRASRDSGGRQSYRLQEWIEQTLWIQS